MCASMYFRFAASWKNWSDNVGRSWRSRGLLRLSCVRFGRHLFDYRIKMEQSIGVVADADLILTQIAACKSTALTLSM